MSHKSAVLCKSDLCRDTMWLSKKAEMQFSYTPSWANRNTQQLTHIHSKCKLTQLYIKPYQNMFLSTFLAFLPVLCTTKLTSVISPSSGSWCLRVNLPLFCRFSAKIINKFFISTRNEKLWFWDRRMITTSLWYNEMFHCPSVKPELHPISQDSDEISSLRIFKLVVFFSVSFPTYHLKS